MADRVSANIIIGGDITPEQFEALTHLIGDEDLRIEWDGDPFTPDMIEAGEPLSLCAHEVSWGNFNALEQYCCDQRIPYRRWSGGCPGSFGAERIVFDGKHGPFNYDADEDDRIVLTAETIALLGSMRAIRAYLKPTTWDVPALVIAGQSRPS
ncbi:MAG: hypothetical protein ABL882_08160 [Sphingopyxis sp.]